MANTLKFLRGLETNRAGQTPAAGEPLWVTDTDTLYVGDGSTAGGIAIGNVVSGGAFHDGFSDFVTNEHIDWTNTSSALSTTGTVTAAGLYRGGTDSSTGAVRLRNDDAVGWRNNGNTGDNLIIGNAGGFEFRYSGFSEYTFNSTAANFFDNNVTTTGTLSAGAITGTSFGGITSANLVDKAAAEVITGSWRLQNNLNQFGIPTTNNEAEIVVNTGNAGSPQIGFTEHGDMSWAIGGDDNDNSFKIHGVASSTIPTIDNLASPYFELSTSGNLTISGAISGTSFGGIASANLVSKAAAETITGGWTFNVGIIPGSGSDVFDSYEEGYYDPVLTGTNSGGYTAVAGSNTMAYTKIGRVVHVQGRIQITTESSPSGRIRVTVPFVIEDLTDTAEKPLTPIALWNHGTSITDPVLIPIVSQSYVELYYLTATGGLANISETTVDADWYLNFNFSYITSA